MVGGFGFCSHIYCAEVEPKNPGLLRLRKIYLEQRSLNKAVMS